MIHRIFIALAQMIANTFFRRIDVVGIENVPLEGPLIFAGNHPNALMDGFLLNAKCGRWPLHFMASDKLWKYKLLGKILDATGTVPVSRRDDHAGKVDNRDAFDRLYAVLESGNCMGIFPEGISHVESQLTLLKTGTARIALSVTARGKTVVKIIPCGLNYIHRHRFRSQVLIEFGEPIVITDAWVKDYQRDEQETVRRLTDQLARSLTGVTLNAPDWRTLRFIQTARRLYKPATAELSPGQYIELSRRFIDGYLLADNDPELMKLRNAIENYQSRLDLLGLKDYQLRQPLNTGRALRKLLSRSLKLLVLLPLAIPGAVLHLPVGWVAATVGEHFSYEQDDIATLKVFATILLLPVLYLFTATLIGLYFGFWWALAAVIVLPLSFLSSVRIIEAEVGLFVSMMFLLRLTRLGSEVEALRQSRAELVREIRELVEQRMESDAPRFFSGQDFAQTTDQK
ncbi:MAG: lysophospholipid acyltransferase family protein [Xanthomonadales bacterium]|nr:lysophospholipid acyltransferase family protein [Xanthomonadales bacterium]